MNNISQLAQQNIKNRRKRPPLPPGVRAPGKKIPGQKQPPKPALPPPNVPNQLKQKLAQNLTFVATKGQVSPRTRLKLQNKPPPGVGVPPSGAPPPGLKPRLGIGRGRGDMLPPSAGRGRPPARLKPLPKAHNLSIIAEDAAIEEPKKKPGLSINVVDEKTTKAPKKRPGLSIAVDDDDEEERKTNTTRSSTRKLGLTIHVDDEDGDGYDDDDNVSVYTNYSSELSRSSSDVISIGNFEVREFGLYDETSSSDSKIKDELIILSALGQGAGGIVYKAIHKPTMRVVAVKTIPVFDPTKRAQMLKELKALYCNRAPIDMKMSHLPPERRPCPFIVSFHDAYMNPEQCNVAIVVEYMDGGSLEDIMDVGGCDNEVILAQISYRILRGFQFIHKQHQIHRDIKPANLLINHRGEVKISDFGIVRELDSTQAMASTFVGTLTYMSPERISGHSYNANSDIWSFGLSLMSLALGSYPLNQTGGYWALLSSLNDDPVPKLPSDRFSEEIIDFVDRCLQKDPNLRPDTEELLKHPFIARVKAQVDKQLIVGENVTPSNQEDNLNELDEILAAFCESAYADNEGDDFPMIDVELDKLCNLARQFGITPTIVEDTFIRHNNEQYKKAKEKHRIASNR